MSNNTKKYTAVIVLGLAIVTVSFFSFRSSSEPKPTQPQGEQTATTTDWLTYHDPKYHFRIDYRPNLSIVQEDQYIGFVDAKVEGPDRTGSSVFIEPTSFATPEEEVAQSNKVRENQFSGSGIIYRTVIDGPITINGYRGIVTHEIQEGYDHPFPKNVMLIKDGNLFTISDETADYQRTWNSFHFE